MAERVRLFASLSNDALREAPGAVLRDLPSYDRLILAAYACGFACGDMNGARARARVGCDPAALLPLGRRARSA